MGVSVGEGKGNRRNVAAEVNLIPFIDLLSVCILFLLMTAVWVQISKMSAFTQPSGESTVRNSEVTSLSQSREDRDWDVLLTKEGVQIVADGRLVGKFAVEDSKAMIQKYREKLSTTKEPKISLRTADDVAYENMIQVLDALFLAKLTQIAVGGM